MPKISIIVPVYNTEKYLRPCLDSIKAQTFGDFEAILVDDGSKDQSGAICDEYADFDPRFVVIHKQNEGVSKARITAFEHSKGSLITFIDSDDYVSEDFLEKMHGLITSNKCDFVCCYENDVNNGVVTPTKRTVPPGIYNEEGIRTLLVNYSLFDKTTRFAGLPMMLCTKMFQRNKLKDALYESVDFWYGEDLITTLSIMYKAVRIGIIDEHLYYYVHYDSQVTRKFRTDYFDAYCKLWKKEQEIDTENLLSEQMSYRIWKYSIRLTNQARRHFPETRDYVSYVSSIFDNSIVRKYVFKHNIFDVYGSLRVKIKYYLLKFRLYYLFTLLSNKK